MECHLNCSSVHSLPYSMFGVQFSSGAQLCLTLCDPIDCSTPGFPITNSWSLLKLKSIKSVMPCNHLILCRPLLLLPSILPNIQVFSNESVLCIRWPKYWSFTFSISPSSEYSGLISLQLTSLISMQSKGLSRVFSNITDQKHQFLAPRFLYSPTLTSIHDYWKNHSFDQMDFWWQSIVSAFELLSRLIIAFLPRSKHLLISWLQSPSTVILKPPKIKSLTASFVSPSICHEVMGPAALILVFGMLSFKPVLSTLLFHFQRGYLVTFILLL